VPAQRGGYSRLIKRFQSPFPGHRHQWRTARSTDQTAILKLGWFRRNHR
jgi:hypothetical protein